MSDDVYRRAGRGGAGNYYSKKDIEEVDKRVREQQDTEAQRPVPEDPLPSDPADPPAVASSSGVPAPPPSSSSSSAYARSGRGGAGNFVDPAQVAGSSATTTAVPAGPSATSSSAAGSVPRYSGRGGAGNYSHFDPNAPRVIDEEQERKRKEALDSGILKDIQESLPKPSKAYYMHEGGAKNCRTKADEPEM